MGDLINFRRQKSQEIDMKVIVAGSRTCTMLNIVRDAMDKAPFHIDEVVSGGARGVDTFGEMIANARNIPVKRFPADWDKYGKSAGYKRNVQMSEYGQALIAIWDGKSVGTKHMIEIARQKHLPVFIYPL